MARTFAARLRDLRLTKRLTQREVAVRLGIAPSTLGMYEAGKREPDNEILVAIAEVYETSVILPFLPPCLLVPTPAPTRAFSSL